MSLPGNAMWSIGKMSSQMSTVEPPRHGYQQRNPSQFVITTRTTMTVLDGWKNNNKKITFEPRIYIHGQTLVVEKVKIGRRSALYEQSKVNFGPQRRKSKVRSQPRRHIWRGKHRMAESFVSEVESLLLSTTAEGWTKIHPQRWG